ncbi:transmembrane protein 231-like [Ylistrum balloti]|uniref:transmembrane protein 231-like n=1 Tax=Ylistrum balloti TaxID=509963 RepID=UPI002905E51C|nr:transmembrane protein 231-like [Ylistrum balloti]
MAVYEVFAHPELRRYKTHLCTKATLLMFVVLFVTFIPPLFVVYRSYGFWIKEDYYRETPRVLFKKELILVLELDDTSNAGLSYLTYSTYQRYNELQQQNLRVPVIQSREDDANGDGKNDGLIMKIEMPLLDQERVSGIKLLLFFDYRLERFSSFGMESLAYVTHDSIKSGAKYEVFGELRIKQKQALDHKGLDTRFNSSLVDSTSAYAEAYQFSTIFSNYAQRNVTTVLNAPYSVWTSGRGAGQPFVFSSNISYTEDVFLYTPGFWYMVKWGWVQYVSVLLLFLFVFDRIKVFIFQNQLVTTIVEKPWKADKFS